MLGSLAMLWPLCHWGIAVITLTSQTVNEIQPLQSSCGFVKNSVEFCREVLVIIAITDISISRYHPSVHLGKCAPSRCVLRYN